MENQSLLLTLGTGVLASFVLFFIFYKVLRQSSKISALLTILIVQLVYIPLAATHWDGLDVFAIHFAFFTMAAAGLGIITSKNENQKAQPHQRKKLHPAPMVIIGFFVVLAMVDATIITLANKGASADFMRQFLPEPKPKSVDKVKVTEEYKKTHERYMRTFTSDVAPAEREVTSAFPGTVANDYQKKYSLYNNYISQLQNQHERGWQIKDGWVDKPVEGKPALFRINVRDKQGSPITGAQVTIAFLRPSNKAMDITVQLPEQNSGLYGQAVTLPAPGLWDLLITIKKGDDIHEVKGDTQIQAAS